MFLDIGGVLLTDGWDHHARKKAAKHFKLKWNDMEERHHLNFDLLEAGRLTMEDYLNRTVFHEERPFTRDQFQEFIFAQSHQYPEMIDLIVQLKNRHGLKIVAVNNEGRELNAYRILKFNLCMFVDCFISSCFVGIRKPDADIFRLALDIAQISARQVLYIENTPMFVQIAEGIGIRSILHTNHASTCAQLAAYHLPPERTSQTRLLAMQQADDHNGAL